MNSWHLADFDLAMWTPSAPIETHRVEWRVQQLSCQAGLSQIQNTTLSNWHALDNRFKNQIFTLKKLYLKQEILVERLLSTWGNICPFTIKPNAHRAPI